MPDSKISAASSTIPLLSDSLPLARASDNTARRVTIGALRGGLFNARDYGAKGDGTTDDAAAIQAAIGAAAAAGGGTVFFPSAIYRINTGLTVNENISLVGPAVGANDYVVGPSTLDYFGSGTAVACGISVGYPRFYATVTIENIHIRNSGAGLIGVRLDACRATLTGVMISTFATYGLSINFGINSLFTQVIMRDCGVGLYVDPASTSTTLVFQACYFHGGVNAVQAAHCNSLYFDGFCVFESCTGDAVILDNISVVVFLSPYFENVGGRIFVVGATTAVQSLTVTAALLVGGAYTDPTKDVFYLDRVENADLHLADCPQPVATKLRTTANTGGVRYTADDRQITGVNFVARGNTTAYLKAAGITVTVAGHSLQFVCVTAGTSAGSQPGGYGYGAYQVTDGTAVFQWAEPECVYDTTQTTLIRRNNVPVLGALQLGYSNTGLWDVAATFILASGEFVINNRLTNTVALRIHPISNLVTLSSSAWNGGHLVMGNYHLWVDSSDRLRIKSSAPGSDTDGTIVGAQS